MNWLYFYLFNNLEYAQWVGGSNPADVPELRTPE